MRRKTVVGKGGKMRRVEKIEGRLGNGERGSIIGCTGNMGL